MYLEKYFCKQQKKKSDAIIDVKIYQEIELLYINFEEVDIEFFCIETYNFEN